MTPDELDRWAAEKVMGWHELSFSEFWISGVSKKEIHKSEWHPSDSTTGQIWMVVQRMVDVFGFTFALFAKPDAPCAAVFSKGKIEFNAETVNSDYICLAILKAAWQAVEGK